MNEPTEKQQMQAALDKAENERWVAHVMLSSILTVTGPVVVTKDIAQQDLTDKGIDITESDDGEALIVQLKDKSEIDAEEAEVIE